LLSPFIRVDEPAASIIAEVKYFFSFLPDAALMTSAILCGMSFLSAIFSPQQF
jgi:hypothetical protein